ncbi:hypothetical protein [Frigoriglobus tundricola]|uniref:hypothetical protein n=1 Tax=Frigoriglobus tundricola TaxID=2774151 RepID=UPI00148E9124|nr:hypothetical protein [Frigoriglobus tundricola]
MALERFGDPMHAQYGSHVFSAAAETTDLRITPTYDAAGRTVPYSVYSITIREYISPSIGGIAVAPTSAQILTAAAVKSAIATLSKNGDVFRYQSRGLGDLVINTGATTDVVWGPKPRVIGVKLHGGLTVELTWTVEVAIPNCADAVFKFALMEFNFKLSFDKDRQGYTTRVYSGFLRIPQTKRSVGDRTLSDSADAYLEKIYPPMLPGFRRIPGSWVLSEDKCRGDFTITDEEMPPTAPPVGCIEAESNHVYHTTGSLAKWGVTLSAKYDIQRGASPVFAVQAFLALLSARMATDVAGMKVGDGLDLSGSDLAPKLKVFLDNKDKLISLVPVAASASEPSIYGRTQVQLSVTLAFAGVGFGAVFAKSSLWTSVPAAAGGVWKDWALNVGTLLGPRGYAQLVFRPNEDSIVDLCGRTSAATPGGGAGSTIGAPPAAPPSPGGGGIFGLFGGGLSGLLSGAIGSLFPPPTPATSWLHYKCDATVHADTGRVVVTTLPNSPIVPSPQTQTAVWDVFNTLPVVDGQSASAFPPLAGIIDQGPGGQGGSQSDVGTVTTQQRTRPKLYVTITGQALARGVPDPDARSGVDQRRGPDPHRAPVLRAGHRRERAHPDRPRRLVVHLSVHG